MNNAEKSLFVFGLYLAFMVATLLLGKTGLPILMFAGIDALAATWTLVALKK